MSDTNPTLGEFLRQEREKRGITIEQVASATKIGLRTLHALESDNYHELPAKPFIRGFVISYCRFVGLDHKEILTHQNSYIDQRALERPNREGGHSGYAFEKREGEQNRTVLWAVMGVFIVLGGIVIFVLKPSLHHHKNQPVDKLRALHAPTGQVEASTGSLEALLPGITGISAPTGIPLASASPIPVASALVVAVTPEKPPSPKASVAPSPSPAPAASVAAQPPLVLALPSPSPSPAAPSPTSDLSAKAQEVLQTDPGDELNSGKKLKPSKLKHKAVFKALASVLIRYKVDNRPITKFIFKEGKILVLRAENVIRFQTASPKAIEFSYNGGAYKSATVEKNLRVRTSGATLIFPPQATDTTNDSFSAEKPLPGAAKSSAAPPGVSPVSSP